MQLWLRNNSNKLTYWLLYALVVVAGLYYSHGTRLFLNADALSYISIAKLYADGQFVKAVNTHWSPLFSWMLVPIIKCHGDAAYWGKVLIVVGTIPSLELVRRINVKIGTSRIVIFFTTLTVTVVLLHPALVNFTPDILLVAPLLYVIYKTQYDDFETGHKVALSIAAVAALGYYLKHYMLGFFILYFCVVMCMRFATGDYSDAKVFVKRVVQTLFFFFLFITPWVIGMSLKAGKLTFSTAPSYNTKFLLNPNEAARDFREKGLIHLPYAEAYSYWDDPSKLQMPQYNGLQVFQTIESRSYFKSWMNENYERLYSIVDFMLDYHALILMLAWLCACAWILIHARSTVNHYAALLFPLVLYCMLYIVIVVDYRYCYFPLLLIVLASGKLLSDALCYFKTPLRQGSVQAWWLTVLIAITFTYLLGHQSWNKVNEYYQAGLEKSTRLQIIARQLKHGSNYCNAFTNSVQTDLMYVADLKYFGKLNEHEGLDYTARELSRYNIRYVIAQAAIPDSLQKIMRPVIENDQGIWVYETNVSH